MASNRRRDGGAGLARAFKAALMCSLLAAAGIGYVRQTMDQDRLGRLQGEQETRLAELRDEYRQQLSIRSTLSSPEAIRMRVAHHRLNLGVATPQQRQFISVPTSQAGPSALLASQPATTPGMTTSTGAPAPSRVPTALAQLPH